MQSTNGLGSISRKQKNAANSHIIEDSFQDALMLRHNTVSTVRDGCKTKTASAVNKHGLCDGASARDLFMCLRPLRRGNTNAVHVHTHHPIDFT